MRTQEIKVYKFDELNEKARDRAKQWYAEGCGYVGADDALESIKALAAHFDGEMKDWSIDYFNSSYSSASFEMPEMSEKEIRSRLKELGSYNRKTGRGNGDCKLTGYTADEDAIDGFRAAFRAGERDLTQLMDAAFDSWLKAAQADCEWQYEDEQFSENCEANGYEFYEDGSRA